MKITLSAAIQLILTGLEKLMSLILAILMSSGQFAAPPTDDPITALDPDEVLVTFNVIGDSQVNVMNYNRIYFDLVLQDINNAVTNQDAFMVVGDITENSLDQEWQMIRNGLLL